MKKSPYRIVLTIALVVLAAALLYLAAVTLSYCSARSAYNRIADEAFSAEQVQDVSAEGKVLDRMLTSMVVDWDALKAQNSDTIAWLRMPGTPIDYPVVWCGDNVTYLTRSFNGKEGGIVTAGSLFLEAANTPTLTDDCSFIYGHNLNDGTMFAAISDLGEKAKFNSQTTLYLATPGGNVKLHGFALIHCAADDPIVETSFSTAHARNAYVQDKINRSTLQLDNIPDAEEITRVFAFSTCDNHPDNGRWILFCYVEESTNPAIPAVQTQSGMTAHDKAAA